MAVVKGFTPFIKRLKRFTENDAITGKNMLKTGDFAAGLIQKRTRLGYGVPDGSKRKKSLRAMRKHKKTYTLWRVRNERKLYKLTTPKKHNLTLTGQMINSIQVLRFQTGVVIIAPKGQRNDGRNNYRIAEFNTKAGWRFNDITGPEEKQVTRFFRRTFGDLARKTFR